MSMNSPAANTALVDEPGTYAAVEEHGRDDAYISTGGELRFDRTVPRRLVHRASVGEVFLTDAVAAGPNRFLVAAQLPRGHALYGEGAYERYDPLLIVETCRQASILVCHEFYGVPADWVFVFRKARLEIVDPAVLRMTPWPARLELVGEFGRLRFNAAGRLTRAIVRYEARLEGLMVGGEMSGSLSFMPLGQFNQMRLEGRAAKSLPAPGLGFDRCVPSVEPDRVGRAQRRNVVIGVPFRDEEDRLTYEVVVDHGHPSLCDHRVDHVSGMLLNEACRQAAVCAVSESGIGPVAAADAVPLDFTVEFTDFGEHEFSTYCRIASLEAANGAGRVEVDIDLVQDGARIGASHLGVVSWR